MDSNFIFSLIAAVLGVGGAMWGAANVVARALRATEQRFDRLEARYSELEHSHKQGRSALQGNIDLLNYKLETVLEYRINANTELIQHKAKRFEEAIKTLSGALERVSDGRYVPRGGNSWPTGDIPTDLR